MPLARMREPFDHPEWLFELKWDGFRALLFTGMRPRLVSRNANVFGRFVDLAHEIDRELRTEVVLDGEIVSLDREGRPQFYPLMFGRAPAAYVAFDVLAIAGQDLRPRPLRERKRVLRRLIARRSPNVLYADHVSARGIDFFHLVCARDLEGIVAKWTAAPYGLPSSWIKVKNREYSQARDRHELFERFER